MTVHARTNWPRVRKGVPPADVLHRPAEMWRVIAAIGVLTAALMWLYDKIVQPKAQTEPAAVASVP